MPRFVWVRKTFEYPIYLSASPDSVNVAHCSSTPSRSEQGTRCRRTTADPASVTDTQLPATTTPASTPTLRSTSVVEGEYVITALITPQVTISWYALTGQFNRNTQVPQVFTYTLIVLVALSYRCLNLNRKFGVGFHKLLTVTCVTRSGLFLLFFFYRFSPQIFYGVPGIQGFCDGALFHFSLGQFVTILEVRLG